MLIIKFFQLKMFSIEVKCIFIITQLDRKNLPFL